MACGAAVAKETGWVDLLHSFVQQSNTAWCIIQCQKKVNHSTVASQERTPAKPPAMPGLLAGQTYRRAQWAFPVLRTCLIVTTRYGRSRNQPLPNSQHDCSSGRRRRIAKPARTVTLSRRLSKQSWVCSVAGSDCVWLRLGMRMPRMWRTALLLAVRNDGSSCCVGTKIPFLFILHNFYA